MIQLIHRIRNINYHEANSIIKGISGIVNYFSSDDEKALFIANHDNQTLCAGEDKVAYGDWQTPIGLAEKVCAHHLNKYGAPDIVIEPTCGLGAFVFAAIRKFPNLSEIHALDINARYTDELKLNLLLDALNTPDRRLPDIYIYNDNFFDFDFTSIIEKSKTSNRNLGIIGNPPWVTNSRLGKDNFDNLPTKSNRYGLKGIEAITGKSNFDISEYITMHLLDLAQFSNGGISFLLKNSVIRNILIKQHSDYLHVGNIEQCMIDALAEFNVAVDASCFSAGFNCVPEITCSIKDFYTKERIKEFGWIQDSFVADINLYQTVAQYDDDSSHNISGHVWRSGIKHDCSAVLELTQVDGRYLNGYGEIVDIEDDLVFPLLKSSDIQRYSPGSFRKFVLIPQHKPGEDTSQLKRQYPKVYAYLSKHEEEFRKRKSSIYKGKDKFSIFGIGDYSFKPYKIIVSSLYKTVKFLLVAPCNGKPIMLDDTCYQLDFDNLEDARRAYDALNSDEIQSLLQSLIFKDAKRVVTKGLLMRLDFTRLFG